MTICDRRKPWHVLARDLAVVGLVQFAAPGYGMWTSFAARPVHLVLEIGRFRVVHAIDVPVELLDQAPVGMRSLPLFGPSLLAVRSFRTREEQLEATMAALQGLQIGARSDLWAAHADACTTVLQAARPVIRLRHRFPDKTGLIDEEIARTGRAPESLVSLPLFGRKTFWTVLLDSSTAEVVGFIPLDSF